MRSPLGIGILCLSLFLSLLLSLSCNENQLAEQQEESFTDSTNGKMAEIKAELEENQELIADITRRTDSLKAEVNVFHSTQQPFNNHAHTKFVDEVGRLKHSQLNATQQAEGLSRKLDQLFDAGSEDSSKNSIETRNIHSSLKTNKSRLQQISSKLNLLDQQLAIINKDIYGLEETIAAETQEKAGVYAFFMTADDISFFKRKGYIEEERQDGQDQNRLSLTKLALGDASFITKYGQHIAENAAYVAVKSKRTPIIKSLNKGTNNQFNIKRAEDGNWQIDLGHEKLWGPDRYVIIQTEDEL